jgi:AcrR family transcriptional regulator
LGTLDPAAGRILKAAREQLFTHGYHALTMDGLAHELGMRKKTLYAHFAGKDEIVAAIIEAAGCCAGAAPRGCRVYAARSARTRAAA